MTISSERYVSVSTASLETRGLGRDLPTMRLRPWLIGTGIEISLETP